MCSNHEQAERVCEFLHEFGIMRTGNAMVKLLDGDDPTLNAVVVFFSKDDIVPCCTMVPGSIVREDVANQVLRLDKRKRKWYNVLFGSLGIGKGGGRWLPKFPPMVPPSPSIP